LGVQNSAAQFLTYVPPASEEQGQAAQGAFDRTAAQLFLALWLACHEQELLAVATLKSTATSAPRLVALMPQEAEVDAVGVQVRARCMRVCRCALHACAHGGGGSAHAARAVQVQPGGFAVHTLPYTDELRIVSPGCPSIAAACLPALAPCEELPKPYEPPRPFAVNAACALVDALSDDAVTRFQFENPEAAFAAAVLRAQVLGRDPPARADFNSMHEYLRCRTAAAPVPLRVKEDFLDRVCCAAPRGRARYAALTSAVSCTSRTPTRAAPYTSRIRGWCRRARHNAPQRQLGTHIAVLRRLCKARKRIPAQRMLGKNVQRRLCLPNRMLMLPHTFHGRSCRRKARLRAKPSQSCSSTFDTTISRLRARRQS
jgi:Ku70/Ku80 beta-barrel domain